MGDVIVGIGEILWDVFPKGKVLGGAPANFVYHTSQFGCEGYAVSAIGNDILGIEIQDSLREKELKYLIEKTPFPTGTVHVTLDSDGSPKYEITERVAWDNIPFTAEMEALARRTKTVCFGTLAQRSKVSRNTINRFLDAMPKDSYKVFDINLRQHFYTRELIEHSLTRCNILKINDEELAIVGKLLNWVDKSNLQMCRMLLENYSLEMVVLTEGAIGSYVISTDTTSFKKTPRIVVADTVGAGDSFTASFIVSLLNGKTMEEAHQFAVEVSAFVCTQHGAMPLLPDELIGAISS